MTESFKEIPFSILPSQTAIKHINLLYSALCQNNEIIQGNNLPKIEKIQGNNLAKIEKIQGNNLAKIEKIQGNNFLLSDEMR